MAHQSGDQNQSESSSEAVEQILAVSKRLTSSRNLVIAANRGPLSFTEDHTDELMPKLDSSYGSELFVSLTDVPITWIAGAVGASDRRAANELSTSDNVIKSDVLPSDWSVRFVSPPRRVHHKFYNIICNPLLWFLVHGSWSPTFTPNIGFQEHDAWERGYRSVNEMFADQVMASCQDDGLALISRGYQLMLVPGMVRDREPDGLIQHSFDTPWPWPDELGMLPPDWRQEILTSLLCADAISFPSISDINAFISCVTAFVPHSEPRTSGLTATIEYGGRTVRLSVSTPSIRTEQITDVTKFDSTKRYVETLSAGESIHTFVTVDRAEPHKNIVRSINAFGELLSRNHDLVGEARFLLFLTSGPAHISAYKRLSDEIRRAARRVNEKAVGDSPVRIYEENNFYRSVAALSIYDTLVSVPVIDRNPRSVYDGSVINTRNGGMILSDTGGAAELLSENVSTVGYTDIAAMADAMGAAIEQSSPTRRQNGDQIRTNVSEIDSSDAILRVLMELENASQSR